MSVAEEFYRLDDMLKEYGEEKGDWATARYISKKQYKLFWQLTPEEKAEYFRKLEQERMESMIG